MPQQPKTRVCHRSCRVGVALLMALQTTALPRCVSAQSRRESAKAQFTRGAEGDSITIRILDLDLRTAVQTLAPYLDRPVVFGTMPATRVTLETPRPIRRAQVLGYLRGLLDSQNMELYADSGGLYRVRQKATATIPVQPTASQASRAAVISQGPVDLYVIRLKHARATEIAATINALYGRAYSEAEVSSRFSTLSQQLQQIQGVRAPVTAAPEPAYPAPVKPGAVGATGQTTPSGALSAETTIIPDASTNSLLVRGTKQDFDLVRAAVDQLDLRPLQVLVEVLIAEVNRDRSLDFGVNVNVPGAHPKGRPDIVVSGATNTDLGLGNLALHVMGYSQYDVDLVLKAAAARGDAKILSRPILVAANNEDAEILVGSQRPFVQVARALPTETPTMDEVVQYRDVGTRLVIRPTVSADGYVMLQITQEVNQATAETQFNAPVIATRSLQTRLLIRDSQTVVLGGLTDKQKDISQQGVPLLSSIPLIGGLFGHASRHTNETELFIFLTPYILRTDEDATKATQPLRKRAEDADP